MLCILWVVFFLCVFCFVNFSFFLYLLVLFLFFPFRNLALRATAPERAVELQVFPALQDLRLEGVPLEHVQGSVLDCFIFIFY